MNILETAMRQSAYDLNCAADDFMKAENVVVMSEKSDKARKYLDLPFFCNIVTYGGNVVASVSPECEGAVRAYIDKYDRAHLFETPHIYAINDALREHGFAACFMAEYWLPDTGRLAPLPCRYETRLMTSPDFAELYTDEWSNALCKKRRELDVLGVGAYDGGRLIGLAACSADCEDMWQIGVDVLPEYRRQGIAAALTSSLASEIMKRGKVPFYCCAWCNLASARNAVKSGFRPAWAEMTFRSSAYINEMNS